MQKKFFLLGEYDVIKQKIKRLEWQLDDVTGSYKSKSGISVQYQNPSFYIKRKCILNEHKLDEINDLLWNRVDSQMKFSYINFKSLYKMLSENSYSTINHFIYNNDLAINNNEEDLSQPREIVSEKLSKQDEEISLEKEEKNLDGSDSYSQKDKDKVTVKSNLLKQKLNKYFNNQFDLDDYTRDYDFDCENKNQVTREQEMKRLVADIRKFIFTYQSEIKLNGLIIARIFHGIGTPRFPNEIWARNRLFWRSHLDFDFEQINKIATEQLLSL